ncbi:MAG: hypothetical protein AAGF78_10955 [Pseudomonadota bacterium]
MVNNTETPSCTMTNLFKRLTANTFLKDTMGAMALLAMLYGGLWMPVLL